MAKNRKVNKKIDGTMRTKRGNYTPTALAASQDIEKSLKRVYEKYHGKLSNDDLFLLTIDNAFHEKVYQNDMGAF